MRISDWSSDVCSSDLVEDVMNRNIDEYARRYYADPQKNPAVPVEQIRAFVFSSDKFDRVRLERPEWAKLADGIYGMRGRPEGRRAGTECVRKCTSRVSPAN